MRIYLAAGDAHTHPMVKTRLLSFYDLYIYPLFRSEKRHLK